MSVVKETRNLFVDTSRVLIGNSLDTTINLPQNLMRCNENEIMRISLGSFSMNKNWLNINGGNNKFYIIGSNGAGSISFARIEIPVGNYKSFTDPEFGLCTKIAEVCDLELVKTGVNDFGITTPATECLYDEVNNRITLEFNLVGGTNTAEIKLVSFTLPDYNYNTAAPLLQGILGTDYEWAYQSSAEILGGCQHSRLDVSNDAQNAFEEFTNLFQVVTKTATDVKLEGYYQGSLKTEENIYLRTDLNSTSFQTSSFDLGGSLFPYVKNSQILAKIPIESHLPAYNFSKDTTNPLKINERYITEVGHQLVQFLDNGANIFSIRIPQKHVSSMRLFLTDRLGRILPASAEQISCGGINWTATIRVDVLGN